MMAAPATALEVQEPPFHRCLVISDPQTNGGMVVLAGVTTDEGTLPDRDCIPTPADWNQLDRNSDLAYSTCRFGPAVKSLEAAGITVHGRDKSGARRWSPKGQ